MNLITGLWILFKEILRLLATLFITVTMVTVTAFVVPVIGILGAITGLVETTQDIVMHPK